MAEQKFAVWSTNPFNDEMLDELIAHFYNLEAAKDFVDYQFSVYGNTFVILQNNKRILNDD